MMAQLRRRSGSREAAAEASTATVNCGTGIAPAQGRPGTYICPLAPYNSPVTWTNLGLAGNVTQWYEDTMVQDGEAVSTPSAADVNGSGGVTGFSTPYTGLLYSSAREKAQLSLPTPFGTFKESDYG